MQKVVTVKVLGDGGQKSYQFEEIKEVNDLLKDGFKVISVTNCPAPAKGFFGVFLLVLEKN